MPLPARWPDVDEVVDVTVDTFDDHWAWRPDWTPGRPCLYWYLTFEDQPAATVVAERAAGDLSGLDCIDPVPPRWLHLTLCDVGWLDEMSDEQLGHLVDAVASELQDQPPLRLTLGPVTAFPDAVTLEANPVQELRELRRRIGTAMNRVGVSPRYHHEADFWPHVTLGYVNRAVPIGGVLGAVGDPSASATVTVDRLTLAAVGRSDGHYQWDCGAVISLTGLERDEAFLP